MWTPDPAKIITAEDREQTRRAVLVSSYGTAVQDFIDAKARERDYDSILSAISYRDDANPQFAAEAAALFAWRSAVWTYATAELSKAVAGARSIPPIDAFLGELPAFTWPGN